MVNDRTLYNVSEDDDMTIKVYRKVGYIDGHEIPTLIDTGCFGMTIRESEIRKRNLSYTPSKRNWDKI